MNMGLPLSVSEMACFQCAKPEGWADMAILLGRVVLCQKHAAVFVAVVEVKNAQVPNEEAQG